MSIHANFLRSSLAPSVLYLRKPSRSYSPTFSLYPKQNLDTSTVEKLISQRNINFSYSYIQYRFAILSKISFYDCTSTSM
jgi:hypothetical protein